MTTAATLLEAANLTQENLFPLWQADTLMAKTIAFWQAITGQFHEETPGDRPIRNWISIIAAFAPTILTYENGGSSLGLGTEDSFQLDVDYIYRFCKFSYYYSLISAGQKTAILTAYNAQFA